MTVGKLLGGAAVLSVVVAFVPAALAVDRPDDRAGPIGAGAVVLAQSETAQLSPVGTADTVEARIRAGLDARGSVIVVRPGDRAPTRGSGAIAPVTPAAPVAGAGTDWSDPVAVGMIAAVLALLGVTAIYLVEHGRRHTGTRPRGTGGTPAVTH
ncbi:MAG: hypothetical protein ACRC50_09630 [Gaiella sp.]